MKKTILILLLLMLPLMTAVEINMKDEFAQGETLMAKISGNFLDQVEKENIVFYREHVKVPLEYDISKIDDEYYIYAQLGDKLPNDYSLRIENINYMQGVNIVDEDIIKSFTITEELADFKITPGFVIADESFIIEVQNLRNFKIEIDINENQTETTGNIFESLFSLRTFEGNIELFSEELKNLEFDLGDETYFSFIELKTENITYEVPVYLFVSKIIQTEEQDESEETTEEGEESETPSEEEEEIKAASTKICIEMNGTVCGKNEACNGTTEYAKDAVCCIGNCEVIEKDNTGKIIGWSMIIIILAAVIWFFKTKYKGAKKEINLLKIAKGKK